MGTLRAAWGPRDRRSDGCSGQPDDGSWRGTRLTSGGRNAGWPAIGELTSGEPPSTLRRTEPEIVEPEAPAPQAPPVVATRNACAVKLEVFEGPLDLLLHLIRLNEVDIADIPIATISEQYLSYLDLMRDLDIDIAADYLVMAATLAYIKSRHLLPPDEEGDSDPGPDPREELARRLAEYALFKEASERLGQRAILGRDVFVPDLDPEGVPEREPVLDVSVFSLLEALRRVLSELPPEPRAHEVVLERVTVQERMSFVMEFLRGAPHGTALFEELFRSAPAIRHYLVMTFLALLELARLQTLRMFQNVDDEGVPCGPIRVRLVRLEDAPAA